MKYDIKYTMPSTVTVKSVLGEISWNNLSALEIDLCVEMHGERLTKKEFSEMHSLFVDSAKEAYLRMGPIKPASVIWDFFFEKKLMIPTPQDVPTWRERLS